jgi:GNAT superfamily N-acetyltransferase
MVSPAPLDVRALTPDDAPAFHKLRLSALAGSPEAFASSVAEEISMTPDGVRERCAPAPPSAVFGAFSVRTLVGIAGFLIDAKQKHRHKGLLWGVYVAPEWRGMDLGRRLVERVIEHAAGHVLLLHAAVTTSNSVARTLYQRLGFTPYGVETKALCIDGAYYDEELLVLELKR